MRGSTRRLQDIADRGLGLVAADSQQEQGAGADSQQEQGVGAKPVIDYGKKYKRICSVMNIAGT